MKYKIFIGLIGLIFDLQCFAQTSAPIQELREGDTLPNIAGVNFLRSGMPGNFSGWCKDKLVMLDFWATWCSPCVEGLPFMDSLQQQFNGQLEVVPVAYETKAKISSFVAGKPEIQGKGLSYVTDDTLFSKLFPHNVVPHIVWLLSGKVIAITGHEAVSFNHVQQAINDAKFKHYVKRDRDEYDLDSPLVFRNNDIVYRSMLTKFKYGWRSGGSIYPWPGISEYSNHLTKRVVMINLPASSLYVYAAYNFQVPRQTAESVILEIKDTFKYCFPQLYLKPALWISDSAYLEWKMANCYSYEVIFADSVSDNECSSLMLNDLNRMFKIKGVMEKRWRSCYVLKNSTKSSKNLKASGITAKIPSLYPNSGSVAKGFEHMTIDEILRFIGQFNRGIPVVNETSNKLPVDLYFNFTTDVMSIDEVRTGFEKYGFKIIKAKRKLDVLVLKDK